MKAISEMINKLDLDFKRPSPPREVDFSLNSESWKEFLTRHHEWLVIRSYLVNNILYGNIDHNMCADLVAFASTNTGRRMLAFDILESGIFNGIPKSIEANDLLYSH